MMFRSIAIDIIEAVEKGAFLDETADAYFMRHPLAEKQRGLVYQIVSGVIRHRAYLDWIVSRLARKGVKGDVRLLLMISVYQIAFMKKANYHVVKEAVEFVKMRKGVKVASFVNAVLRKSSKDIRNIPLPSDPVRRLAVIHSFPEWLIDRWLARFGLNETEKLCSTLNATPYFTLRINPDRISKSAAISGINDLGMKAEESSLVENALRVDRLGSLLRAPLMAQGGMYVQDEASQLTALGLGPREGEFILDACAGLGTKTMHMRDLMPGAVFIAMDSHMGRLKRAIKKENLIRGNALCPPFRDGLFDAVLLDAPCSSLGIIRKHPEIKWSRSERDIVSSSNYQLDLLRSLWDNLKKNGRLIYSVCSFEPEETTGVLERFRKEKGFVLENPFAFGPYKNYFLSLPHISGMDGFFIARLKKL